MFSVSAILSDCMEGQSSDRLTAENLFSFKTLEEISPLMELEIGSLELEVCSPRKKLFRFKHLSSTRNNTKHMSHDGSRLVSERSEDTISEKELIRRKERELHQCLELKLLNGKRPLRDPRASGSNELVTRLPCLCSGNSKEVLQAGEIEQLNKRLQSLEEDNEVLRQEFFKAVEERKKLMNETYQELQRIHHFHKFRNQGQRFHSVSAMINPFKDGEKGIGLSQVLSEDSDCSILTRDHKGH